MAAADIIEWFADEGLRVYGRIVPPRANLAMRQMVLKDPVGPVAAFTPWNFPINQVVRKVAAALAAGCSMIVKAPEETPAAPAALIRAFADAGLPAGVLGLVYGNPAEISGYLIPHPMIRKITFTGSTPVGKQLAALAGQHMKRVTMELGGHAPVIVAEDADIALAVKTAGGAKFRNAGQVCISPTRFLVHSSIAKDFGAALAKQRRRPEGRRRPGRRHADGPAGQPAPPRRDGRCSPRTPCSAAPPCWPAASASATPATSGRRPSTRTCRWTPGCSTTSPSARWPAIREFDTLDEAIAEANRLPFGLAGYAFTRSLEERRPAGAPRRGRHAVDQHARHALGRDALRRRQGFGLRLRGRPGGAGGYLNTRAVSIMQA